MTIFRESCGYESLTRERCAEFGVPETEAGLWYIEYDYGGPQLPMMRDDPRMAERRERAVEVRLIPNTLARLARHEPILIGVSVPKKVEP